MFLWRSLPLGCVFTTVRGFHINLILKQCGHNTEIVQMLTTFMRRVSSRSPVTSDVMCELGYLLALQNMYKEAHECYSTALKTDDKCLTALVGTESHHLTLSMQIAFTTVL